MATSLHYAPNGNFSNPTPWSLGFNIADCSVGDLSSLPSGVKGLVWIGDSPASGLTTSVKSTIDSCKGNPNLFGFYVADEPDPNSVPAASLKAVSDYIHSTQPVAKTFIVMYNEGSDPSPVFSRITPATTGIDLWGLDPYPCRTDQPYTADYINRAVAAAAAVGVTTTMIVPVFQCFAEPPWIMPTTAQTNEMLARWDSLVPSPVFNYVYSWGDQASQGMTAALSNTPSQQAIYQARFAGSVVQPPPPPPPPPPGTEAYFSGTAPPPTIVGNVGDVYAQTTTSVTQGAPTVTVPAPVATTSVKFWKKGSGGWVAQ